MMFLMDGDGFLSFSIYSYVERESKSPGFSSNKRTNTFGMTLSVAQIIVEDFWSTLFYNVASVHLLASISAQLI